MLELIPALSMNAGNFVASIFHVFTGCSHLLPRRYGRLVVPLRCASIVVHFEDI